MEPSALQSVSRSLESSLDFWGVMLLAATLLVVVGLVLEYWHEIKEFWERVQWPMSSFPWDKLVAISGGILVTLGVAGELYFTYRASRVESKLRENNHRIETLLTQEAGDAKNSALDAAAAAQRAKGKADQVAIVAGAAQREASGAETLAKDVGKQADRLNSELAASEKQLAAVDAKRAELEKSLTNLAICTAPRVIPQWEMSDKDGKRITYVDPLKEFSGYNVIIEFVPEPEARRAAKNLAEALHAAGLHITDVQPNGEISDGVEIQPYEAPLPRPVEEDKPLLEAEIRSGHIADAVVAFLKSYFWQAKKGIVGKGPSPRDTLKIGVGLYPPVTFVTPPAEKKLALAVTQAEERMNTDEKQMDEMMLNKLPEAERKRWLENKERWEKLSQEAKERYLSPCRPLNPLSLH